MDIPEKLREVLKKDGVVAIATLGQDGPHMVNTWNSYVRLTDDGRMLIPAGYMNKTEANVAFNPEVLITLGSSKVKTVQPMRAEVHHTDRAPGPLHSQQRSRHRLSHQGHGGLRHVGSRLRRPQGDLRLDARRSGCHDAVGDADALASCRSPAVDQPHRAGP